MALRLYAIALLDGLHGTSPAPRTELLAVRDVAAIIDEAPYVLTLPDEAALTRHHHVVEEVFTHAAAVVPAPPGTLFRDRGALQQWLELHYVSISDALTFVEDRAEARVHVSREGAREGEEDAGRDIAAMAAECFRTLRRQAVASLPLRGEHLTGIAISAAFLVERSLWKEFADVAEEAHGRDDGLSVTLSGPWPAYDFVRITFGG